MTKQPNDSTPSDSPVLKSTVEQFLEAIAQRGLTAPKTIETDGNRHYFSVTGEPGNRAGWYEFHASEIAYGAFGNVRTGFRVDSWIADIGRPLSSEEKSDIEKKRRENRAEQKARREQVYAEARRIAATILRASTPSPDTHRYLERKKIKAHGVFWWDDAMASVEYGKNQKPFVRIVARNGQAYVVFSLESDVKFEDEIRQTWKSLLIIPMRDEKGDLQSLQFINKSGEKRLLSGGKMQGSHHVLGDLRDSETILIAESFANAATIHEITGHPVVIAFDAENLPTVAKAIRKQKPKAAIFLCADDDWKTKGNPGLTKAAQAAQDVGGILLAPDFGDDRPDDATDFNDMFALLGKDAVTIFFTRHSLVNISKAEATTHDEVGGYPPAVNGLAHDEPGPERPSSCKKRKVAGRAWGGLLTPSGKAP